MYAILSLLTGVEHDEAVEDGVYLAHTYKTAAERYPHLPLADKIQILLFLCQLAVVTRNVKTYYEECENHLTELRKERLELIRVRKRTQEQRHELDGIKKQDESPVPEEEEQVTPMEQDPESNSDSDSDSEQDELASDDDEEGSEGSDSNDSFASDAGSERYKRLFGSRQESLREKALQRDAEQARMAAELAKAKEQQRESKQINAERKRMEDEDLRLARREEAIDREFRPVSYTHLTLPTNREV